MGKLGHGEDILEELTRICVSENITLGRVEAIGAVRKARVGFYDQDSREYNYMDFPYPMEILRLAGNVSVKEGVPMVHAHLVLSDSEGRAFGGHLAAGSEVFACEYLIEAFEGQELVRGYDEATGLTLWTE